jgi:PAS domain S-box-containing protein
MGADRRPATERRGSIRGAIAAAVVTSALGAFYLIAWLTGAAAQWLAAGALTIRTNMAICQALGGICLLSLLVAERATFTRIILVVTTLVLFAVGAMTLAEHVLDRDLGIDNLLVPSTVVAEGSANRPGPFGAFALVLLALALPALACGRARTAQTLAVVAAIAVVVPTIGILYGIDIFYELTKVTRVGWPTLIGLLSLAAGVVMARPDRGMMVLLTADDPGGHLLRRLLLPTFALPLLAGWLRTVGTRNQVFDATTGAGLLVLTLLVAVIAMLWSAARTVSQWADRQQQATAELGKSRRAWQQLAEAMPQMIWTCTPAGACDYLSPQWTAYTGTPANLHLGDGWLEAIHPEDSAGVVASWRAALAARIPLEVAFRLRRHDGQWCWFMSRALPILGDDGAIHKWYGSTTDIEELKQAQTALTRSERRFRDMADAAPAMLWLSDASGVLTYRSRAWHEFTGLPAPVSLADGIAAVHPQDRDRVQAAFAAANQNRHPFTLEYRLCRDGRQYLWVMDAGRPLSSPEGRFQGFVGSVIDIDERRRVEDEIRLLNTTLETRVAVRSAELRRLTLELTRAEQRERNRLAELLHDGLQQLLVAAALHVGLVLRATDFEQREERAARLTELLQDAVASTRTLTGELSPPALRDRGLVAALRWLAEWMHDKHHLRVEVSADGVAEPQDTMVSTLLYQCVRELLLNVVKYAGVEQATVRLASAGDGRLILDIRDDGAGFDPTAVAGPNGQTFGLASIHRRVELVGGQVRLESSPGKGTRVRLEIPGSEAVLDAEPAETPLAPAVRAPAGATKILRVLLVDDHEMFREGLAGILREQPDLEVVGQAADGLEAIELAGTLAPDVVIMDIRMPNLDGVEATRRIVAAWPATRVIGLSTHELADKSTQMQAAGAAAYLTKDGPADALLAEIRRGSSSSPSASSSAA